jgi:hypothetical protein
LFWIASKVAQALSDLEAKTSIDSCEAIAREGFAMLDAEEAKLTH